MFGSQWLLESTYSAVTATWLRIITCVLLLGQDKLNVITTHWRLIRLQKRLQHSVTFIGKKKISWWKLLAIRYKERLLKPLTPSMKQFYATNPKYCAKRSCFLQFMAQPPEWSYFYGSRFDTWFTGKTTLHFARLYLSVLTDLSFWCEWSLDGHLLRVSLWQETRINHAWQQVKEKWDTHQTNQSYKVAILRWPRLVKVCFCQTHTED